MPKATTAYPRTMPRPWSGTGKPRSRDMFPRNTNYNNYNKHNKYYNN